MECLVKKSKWTIALLLACTICLGTVFAESEKAENAGPIAVAPGESLDLYLLIGQSNMAGRGTVEKQDIQLHPQVLTLNKENQWVPAVAPIHFDKKAAGVGPGRAFGIAMAEHDPSAVIGLIPCAVGGTSIRKWQPGGWDEKTKTHPYDDMLKRLHAAQKSGTVKGILWHQGESDAAMGQNGTYEQALTTLIERVRAECKDPHVPFVIGQLGQFPEKPWSEGRIKVDQAHKDTAKHVANTGFVSSDGLTHRGDRTHFSAQSARLLGKRFAQEMIERQKRIAPQPKQNKDKDGKKILYVSPNGNDQWSGRFSEPRTDDGPLATLDAARLKVRQLKAVHPEDSFEVQIRGGLYKLRETVVFAPEDSGSADAPVVYRAYPDETPVFTGGIPITGWKKCSSDPKGIAEKARGKLWVAEIPNDVGDQWVIRSLYDGQTLLQRSRSDGFHYADVEKEPDSNRQGKKLTSVLDYEGKPVPAFDRTVYYREDDIKDWPNLSDIELVLKDRPWMINIIPLDRIDTQKKIAYLAVDPTYQTINPKNRYWVENAIEYLDEPGEWVANTQQGRLYMWPGDDVSDMNVIAPFLQEFIRVEGVEDGPFVSHLRFEGLTFMHGLRDSLCEGDKGLQHDWEMYDKGNAVIRFRFAENCDVASCVITSSSGTGIRMDLHCQQIRVVSNHLHHLGAGGVVLSGYGPGTKDVNKNNVVHDNYIHHIGELLLHAPAIFIAQSGHNEISHNTIHDAPYNGIVVSGCRPHEFYLVHRIPFRRAWVSSIRFQECEPYIKKGLAAKYHNRLEYFLPLLHARENKIVMNDISRTLLKLHDGNAIYFSAMGENNLVERNYLHENYDTAGAIRLDDNPSFTIIRENVITESERGLGLKGPADVINNFIFTETFLRGRTLPAWVGGTKKALPQRNIFMPPASSKSSNGLYLTDDRATNRPFYKNLPKTENSIYFTENTSDPYVPKTELGNDLFSGQPVTIGKDAIKLLYADPLFDEVAMKKKIFRFKEGSPALRLGIKPIDLSQVGSTLAK